MWYPPDPDEPTSELYRLTPPRRRSELREALDAATGADRDDAIAPAAPVLSGPPADRKGTHRQVALFFGGVISNTLGAILATAIVALSVYLWTHTSRRPSSRPPGSAGSHGDSPPISARQKTRANDHDHPVEHRIGNR